MRIDMSTLLVTLVVIFISMITGMFLPIFKIANDIENTLFTVSGIMFSIGLGLTVVSSTQGVRNIDYINNIRENISCCQARFITLFLLLTLFYIFLSYTDNWQCFILRGRKFYLNFRLSFAVTSIYSIIYFVTVFHSIQKFKDELEDRINEEEIEKNNK